MNLAQGEEVPRIIIRRARQRPSEFLTLPAKRLLQHNLPIREIAQIVSHAATCDSLWGMIMQVSTLQPLAGSQPLICEWSHYSFLPFSANAAPAL